MNDSVLYVDPSFTGTGLYFVDRTVNRAEFALIAGRTGTMRTYENYARTAFRVADMFDSYLRTFEPSVVKLEVPPPFGQTSAGLTGLSFLLLERLRRLPSLTRLELINPSFISFSQRKWFSDEASRPRIAQEFLKRQKAKVLGTEWVNEDLLEDNDVATAYLFSIFEKIKGDNPFHEFHTESFEIKSSDSSPLSPTTLPPPSSNLSTTRTTNPPTTRINTKILSQEIISYTAAGERAVQAPRGLKAVPRPRAVKKPIR